jgi:predicted acyl esterase
VAAGFAGIGCALAFAWLAPAAGAADGELTARGSAKQVQVTGATPGKRVKLIRRGEKLDAQRAGKLGGVVFRKVKPGRGYTVKEKGGDETRTVRVFSGRSKPPSTKLYDQMLPAGGYGYLRTRDGTKLALTVHLPGPAKDGPYPTLVEYSGYGYADPSGPESGIGPVAGLLGYAVVDVNMRGTGCSGGAFDYFEPLQALDGYDVVETVARQPWAMHGKVGMVGISYGGISQLFVGAERPPSLAAITPLSVIDDTQTTLYPGGILNTGFAFEWAQDRVEDAKPAGPSAGQPWAWKRIQDGDEVCEANQALHPEAIDLIAKTRRNEFYRPKAADPLAPAKFVDEIEAPTFLACQWTDEQTGGHCPTLAKRFTGTDRKWFTFTNGTHADSLDPETFNRWFDFLEIYVAKRRPKMAPGVKASAPALYSALMGVNGVQLPDDPIQAQQDLPSAQAAFEAQPEVRVLFDNGAGTLPFKPLPGFERSFKAYPPPKAKPRSWFLSGKGKLLPKRRGGGADKFKWDPDARPPTSFTGDTGGGKNGLWTDSPSYAWSQSKRGRALSYLTSRLKKDRAVLGAGEVQVWVRSAARNVDLQATVTEVRRDGKETFVQGGWLRTGARKIDREASSLTEPVPSLRKRDAKTLPRGRWVKVRIPLYYQGHVYRKGSRIRVILSAPGGDQPIWAFDEASPNGRPWVAVAHRRRYPSRLVLPVARGVGAPTSLPPCPGLRGQPCRDFVPFENREFGRR